MNEKSNGWKESEITVTKMSPLTDMTLFVKTRRKQTTLFKLISEK